MTREEIIQAISDDKMMPFIQPDQLAEIVDFVIKNYKPSLPSNLDEAVLKYIEFSDYPPASQQEMLVVYNAFKAGAEWMAGQGITVECGVRVYPTLDGVAHRWVSLYKNGINIDSLKDIPRLKSLGFKDDDEAIVQIRKK